MGYFAEFASGEHLFQFILTILVLIGYLITLINKQPSNILENILFICIGYFFITSTNKTSVNKLENKIQQIDNKVITNTMKIAENEAISNRG